MELLSSLNEMSAGDGFPIVLLSGLQALGALALIVAVLVIMEKVYKKKHPDGENDNEQDTNVNTDEEGDNQ